MLHHLDPQAKEGLLAAALDLYEGELMPAFHLPGCGDFARWLDAERAELRERAAGASWALAVSYEQSAQHTAAVQWARRTVRYAWDDERALRRALVLLDHMGDRAGALRLYDEFARRLRADYESEPSRHFSTAASTSLQITISSPPDWRSDAQ